MTEACFLAIATHHNWSKLQEKGRWLFSRKSKIADDLENSPVAVYLTAHDGYSSVGGLVRFSGPVHHDETELAYPYWMEMNVECAVRSPVAIDKIRDDLTFFPKTRHWAGVLQGQPVKRIPAEDYERIATALRAQKAMEVARANQH